MKKTILLLASVLAITSVFAQQTNAQNLKNNVTRAVTENYTGIELGGQFFKLDARYERTNVYRPMVNLNQNTKDALVPDEMVKDVTLSISEEVGIINPEEFFWFEQYRLNQPLHIISSNDAYISSYVTTADAKGKLQDAIFTIKRLQFGNGKSIICSFVFHRNFAKLSNEQAAHALKVFKLGVDAYEAQWEKAVKKLPLPPLVK